MLLNHVPHLEISLDNLAHNLRQIRMYLANANDIMAVVKDNAYGCGAQVIAQALEMEGVSFFAVATMDEAKELRAGAVMSPILVLGETSGPEHGYASENGIRVTVNTIGTLQAIANSNRKILLHMNIDTGMSRMGLTPDEVKEAIPLLATCPHCVLEGVFTHFASADVPDTVTVQNQRNLFSSFLTFIRAQGFSPRYIHYSNSAACIRFPVPAGYLVRPGIMLYGCTPDPAQEFDIDLRPVASLKAPVVKIKKVTAGTPISYGGTYTPANDTIIATIPIGYAHGLPRLLSNKGYLLIRGKRYRIVGRITMDYCMVDCGPRTDIVVGDECVALGPQGTETITADTIARACETIGYEVLCGLSNRISRYYIRENKIISEHHPLPH